MAIFLVGALDGSLQQTVLHYGKSRIDNNIREGNHFLLDAFKSILIDTEAGAWKIFRCYTNKNSKNSTYPFSCQYVRIFHCHAHYFNSEE